jgi:ATP-dependent helicase/nuclease subunit A
MTTLPPIQSDRSARARAVRHAGSVLVQAPAGSGKTTLLTQRYLRLLATVDAPERILALTFTRRAAEEMRERVAAALHAARAQQCPADLNRETWALAAAAAAHLDAAGIDLARHPARLRIETIDAFNAWLAAQLPISAGTGGSLRMLRKADSSYEQAASRTLAYDEADDFGAAVDRVLGLGDQRWRQLVDAVAAMLPSRDRWLSLLAGGLELLRRQFDEDLALLVTRALDEAAVALGAERLVALSKILHAVAQRSDSPADLQVWRTDASALRARADDIARWRGLITSLLTKGGQIRARVTKSEGFPPRCAEKAAMLDLLEELRRDPRAPAALAAAGSTPEPTYSDAQWERVRDVAQVLLLAAAQLDQVFREQGSADFPAVSMAARRALATLSGPTDLALRLDYRLHHILVDEFQDTSGAQLELLRLLTGGWQRDDGRSIFCVGDPMQSIYGFREAEVGAFLRLAEEGIGEIRFDVEHLSSNFRSAKSVVDWVNATFSRLLPPMDDRDRGAVAYRSSQSALPDAAGVPSGVSVAGYSTRGAEAEALAELIAVNAAEHPDWKIAVLVRARTHAREIAARLRRRGCIFRAVELEPLQSRAVVRDLISLTRALWHLGDRTAWLAVLHAPWAGLELSDLLCVARARPNVWDALCDDAVLALLSDSGRQRCQRVRAVLQNAFLVRSHTAPARWIERTWLGLGGPSCAGGKAELEHARAAFERLRELERRGMPDAAAFDAAFDDLYARDDTAGSIEIMTIHKAKGLEFDLVVVPGLDRVISHRGDEFLLSRQFARPHRDGMVMAARPPVGAGEDRLFAFLRSLAKEEAALEAERLLYVACTRAKWRLHLSATTGRARQVHGSDGESNGDAPDGPRSGSLLSVLWPLMAQAFTPADSGLVTEAPLAANDSAGAAQPHGGPLCRIPLHWSPAPSESPFELHEPPTEIGARLQTPVFDWAGETARQVGSLVHAELQNLRLEAGGDAQISARVPQFKHWLALRGVPAERLPDASRRVMEALIAVHSDPRGRWMLRGDHREAVSEYALSGTWDGRVARVVFDRSFVDEHGVRWVIDYKTSQHMGGGEAEFLDSEVERYRMQMQRYAAFARRLGPERVRVGLYFPLMRAWREWEP